MKRREFVERLGLGSAAILAGGAVVRAGKEAGAKPQSHDHTQINGPLASATVSFGQWKSEPPLNRFPTGGTPPATNQHLLLPYEATIKAGGVGDVRHSSASTTSRFTAQGPRSKDQ